VTSWPAYYRTGLAHGCVAAFSAASSSRRPHGTTGFADLERPCSTRLTPMNAQAQRGAPSALAAACTPSGIGMWWPSRVMKVTAVTPDSDSSLTVAVTSPFQSWR
jgi:hypothetical protein